MADQAIWPGKAAAANAVTFGTAAARPAAAAANANTGYYATDTGEVTFSDGAAWHTIAQTSAAQFAANGQIARLAGSGTAAEVQAPSGTAVNVKVGGGFTLIQSTDNAVGVRTKVAGLGFAAAEGANAKQGVTAAMVAGSVTVANASVTANSRIQVTRAPGGTNPGAPYVSAINAGVSFTVTSTNAADTGTIFYEIFEPG